MFSLINRTLFDIPITWDRSRFERIRSKYRQARRLIDHSINTQFHKELQSVRRQNENIEKSVKGINEYLSRHDQKVSVFENLTDIASETLSSHLERRMDNIRTTIEKQFSNIQDTLQEEKKYWENLRSALDQNVITIDDIHRNGNQILGKQERVSYFSPSVNKTYVVKLHETANASESNSYLDFLEPKIILKRIGQGFLIDNLELNEDIRENSFPKNERKSFSLKRKQSVLDVDDDDEDDESHSSSIALRKRKSISIIEIDDIKPKKRRKRKPQNLDQSKHSNTRISARNQRLTNIAQSKCPFSLSRARRKKSCNY